MCRQCPEFVGTQNLKKLYSEKYNQHSNKTTVLTNSDVLLTVHLSIILVTDQLNAQIIVL